MYKIIKTKNNHYKNNYQLAFTIVELLVVVVIIGILATISVVSYNGIREKAQIALLKSDLKNSSTLINRPVYCLMLPLVERAL